jgi:hypothetical protein
MTSSLKPFPLWKSILAVPFVIWPLLIGFVCGCVIWPFVQGFNEGLDAAREFWEFPDDEPK